MPCPWNLQDTYFVVNNKPCSFFDGTNNGITAQMLGIITENYITTVNTLINFKFSEQDPEIPAAPEYVIIPNHYAIFKDEESAKNYLVQKINDFKEILDAAIPV